MPESTRVDALRGWGFVAIQMALIAILVLLPGADHWPTPAWVEAIGALLMVVGVVLMVVAGSGLGPALTPTPVPSAGGRLVTGGLYRFVRHPIYSGVLALVAGITLRSGNAVTLLVSVGALLFFTAKARWEEQRLTATYPGYEAYAAGTPRFVPGVRSRFGGRSSR